MNVLLIAPASDLEYVGDETRAVQMALRAVTLAGTVTQRDVVQAISQRSWDVLWFACHGTGNGLQLAAGETLTISQLTQDARNAGARLVVLNSCESEDIALRIHYELKVDVIATIVETPDVTAFRTATYLAGGLANGLSTAQAFAKARPGQDRIYRLFSETSETPMQNNNDLATLIVEQNRMLSAQISDVHRRVDEIERTFKKEVTEIKQRNERWYADFERFYPPPLTALRRTSWISGFALFAVCGMFYFKDFRDLIGMPWTVAFGVVLMGYGISLAFFLYGLGFVREPQTGGVK